MSIRKKYDIIVAGGGPSGTVAAIAAARNGARTLLVERWGFLGGMATAGMVSPIHTFHNMRGEQIVGGIPDEIVKRLEKIGGAFPTGHPRSVYLSSYSHSPFEIESMKQVLQEITVEAGVEFLLHTFITDAVKSNNKVEGIEVANKSGKYTIEAKVVIDATGDGDIAAAAGAQFEKGGSDGKCMAGSLIFRMANVNTDKIIEYIKQHPDEFVLAEDPYANTTNQELAAKFSNVSELQVLRGFFPIVKQAQERNEFFKTRNQVMGGFSPKKGEIFVNMANVLHVDGSNVEDLTYAEIETRKQVPTIVSFLQKYIPGFEEAFLVETAPQIGVRESRRITGDYVLTAEDVFECKKFHDGIARGAYPSDVHGPDGGVTHRHVKGGNDYHIPYRCMLPLGLENILVAGRSISAERIAMGSFRVMAQCMAMGQAAGTAAALAVRKGLTPRELDIEQLKTILTKQGAII